MMPVVEPPQHFMVLKQEHQMKSTAITIPFCCSSKSQFKQKLSGAAEDGGPGFAAGGMEQGSGVAAGDRIGGAVDVAIAWQAEPHGFHPAVHHGRRTGTKESLHCGHVVV